MRLALARQVLGVIVLSTALVGSSYHAPERIHFRLISSDGDSLPAFDESNHACTIAGHYFVSFATKQWRSVDSTAVPTCSAQPISVSTDSGVLRVHQDTLAFYNRDVRLGLMLTQRGVLRGDTLRVGALFFDGPPLVYVKAR